MKNIAYNNLKQQFFTLWKELGAKNPGYEFELLTKQYLEPERFYHTLEYHISNVLSEFDSVKYLAKNPKAIKLALFYHDAILDPMGKDNEEKSAQLLLSLEDRSGINHNIIVDASSLVMATKRQSVPVTIDEKIVVDCDWAILGKSKEEFDIYNHKIRQEYLFVPKEAYSEKRIEILQNFLDKPSLYHLEYFKDKYTTQMKKNLERTINNIRNGIVY